MPNLIFRNHYPCPMKKYLYLILFVIPYISACQQRKAINPQEEKISGRDYYKLVMTKDSVRTGAILNNMGFAQSKAISAEKGLRTVNRSLKFYPDNSFAYFNLGRILLDMNEGEKACSNFIKARELGGYVLPAAEEYIDKYCK
jgi:hypothetical protein